MASQCGPDSTKFLQWHSSVGLFQLSLSSGVPVHPASIRWVTQWYPSVHWANQWHSSGIPVYTGPASVHLLRVRAVVKSVCVRVSCCGAVVKRRVYNIYVNFILQSFVFWTRNCKNCSMGETNALFPIKYHRYAFGIKPVNYRDKIWFILAACNVILSVVAKVIEANKTCVCDKENIPGCTLNIFYVSLK